MWAIKICWTILRKSNISVTWTTLLLNSSTSRLLVATRFGLLTCVSSEGRVSLSAKTTQQAVLSSHWCRTKQQASPARTCCLTRVTRETRAPPNKLLKVATWRNKWELPQERNRCVESTSCSQRDHCWRWESISPISEGHTSTHEKLLVLFH